MRRQQLEHRLWQIRTPGKNLVQQPVKLRHGARHQPVVACGNGECKLAGLWLSYAVRREQSERDHLFRISRRVGRSEKSAHGMPNKVEALQPQLRHKLMQPLQLLWIRVRLGFQTRALSPSRQI